MIGISKISWLVSIVLHGALIALLILGPSLRPTVAPELPSGNFMPAELIDPGTLDLPPLEQPLGPTPAELERERLAQELEQKRLDDLARQQKADEQERERIKQQEAQEEQVRIAAQAKADAEKKAEELKQEQARLKKIADDKKEQLRLKKIEDDKKELARVEKDKADKAEEEASRIAAQKEAERVKKEKAEQERKRREAKKKEEERIAEEKRQAKIAAEKAAKQKAAAEKLAAQMAREEQMRQMMGVETTRNKAVDSGLLAQYIAQIVAKVERNWNPPPGVKEGLSCTVEATQIIGGDVVSAKVTKCNGDAAVQRSIEAAVFKASPLPEPADSTLFERNLVFIFEPE